jgi:CyaY protein
MDTPLDEHTYQLLASAELQRLVDALDALAAEREEFEVELSNDILTLEFKDGGRFVINSHRAARQIWMAAGTTAWHFDCRAGAWISSKSSEQLWQVVAAQLSRKLSREISLTAHPG